MEFRERNLIMFIYNVIGNKKFCSIRRHYKCKISLNRFKVDRINVRKNLATSPHKNLTCIFNLCKEVGVTTFTRMDYYLNKGIDKLNRDLDIVNLIEIVKGFYVLK